jgi:DNA mismatch repair ATPase MutS
LEAKYPNKVKNFKMDTLIANGQLTILYQIVPGVADRSFGLNIAEMVGIPKEIIQVKRKLNLKKMLFIKGCGGLFA